MAKSVKQLIGDRNRIKDQIHKKQAEIVSMKAVLKKTRLELKAAKAAEKKGGKKKPAKKAIAKRPVKKPVPKSTPVAESSVPSMQ